jgi:hypothetical protein
LEDREEDGRTKLNWILTGSEIRGECTVLLAVLDLRAIDIAADIPLYTEKVQRMNHHLKKGY